MCLLVSWCLAVVVFAVKHGGCGWSRVGVVEGRGCLGCSASGVGNSANRVYETNALKANGVVVVRYGVVLYFSGGEDVYEV